MFTLPTHPDIANFTMFTQCVGLNSLRFKLSSDIVHPFKLNPDIGHPLKLAPLKLKFATDIGHPLKLATLTCQSLKLIYPWLGYPPSPGLNWRDLAQPPLPPPQAGTWNQRPGKEPGTGVPSYTPPAPPPPPPPWTDRPCENSTFLIIRMRAVKITFLMSFWHMRKHK